MIGFKKHWKKQEIRIAKELNGSRTIRSGGYYQQKGDVKTDSFLLECKCTEKKSFSVSKKILNKIESEAREKALLPVLFVTFIDGGKEDDYAIIRGGDFKSLIGIANKCDGMF